MTVAGVWTGVGFPNLKNYRHPDPHSKIWSRSGVRVWKSDSGNLQFEQHSSRDELGSGLDWTGSGLKPILAGTGLDRIAICFENWRIRTGSDWENFCCICVIILKISKILIVIRFYRFAKWECILPWMAKALLGQFCNSNNRLSTFVHIWRWLLLATWK